MKKYNPEEAIVEVRREFGEHGGVTPSIERSSTFTVLDPAVMTQIFQGEKSPEEGDYFLYSRNFNPTVNVLCRYLAAMEGSESAIATASGISAIACALLQLCRQGDHIIASHQIYGGTHALLEKIFPAMGIRVTFVHPTDLSSIKAAITPQTKVIYTETMGNPILTIANIPALAEIAHQHQIQLVVDNTFTPLLVSPLILGADIVVHSMTKFINGASDIVAGAICASKDFIYQLMDLHQGRLMLLGPTIDPRVAFDVIQRLPHLGLRMREHGVRAMAIAERLQTLGVKVRYPGLPSHPEHTVLKSMLNEGYGFGGMLTIDCETRAKAEKLLSILQNEERFGLIAVSLGYFDTLMSCSGSSTSSEISNEEQNQMGLSPGLIRLAIGYTGSLEVRLDQITRAVKKVFT
ncbi:MAG: cystathionine beta-lyase [Gammaproteobacteria bacterium GWE2_42_36]|nr:MAG: cystathionine beta-lyase [Gammaproteobacteria bacterium GWE2_42_36]